MKRERKKKKSKGHNKKKKRLFLHKCSGIIMSNMESSNSTEGNSKIFTKKRKGYNSSKMLSNDANDEGNNLK